MQVETYECQETAAEPIEACEEAVSLIESMELAGQKELLAQKDDQPTRRCPYREMNRDEQFVYGVMCPGRTQLERYALGPIPLRVLQIASHANSLDLFKQLWVWHATETADPDPVLVARTGSEYDWQAKTFILARWGEVLDSWPILLAKALEKKRQQVASELKALTARLSRFAIENELSDGDLIEKGAGWTPKLEL